MASKKTNVAVKTKTETPKKVDFYSPLLGITEETIRTKPSTNSTRREYLRMKEERELRNKSLNTETPRSESRPTTVKSSTTCIVFNHDDIVKEKEAKCEISSFPLPANDSVDGVKPESATGAKPAIGNTHEARWCMISAVLHMKRLAGKKPKSLKELKKIPLTTQELENLRQRKGKNDNDSDEEPDEYAYLKNCRYLRGKNVKEDQGLTIEEIFS